MNVKRVLTSLIGFPIVLLMLVFGNKYIFSVICLIIALIGMNEYVKCVSKKVNVVKWISYVGALFVGIIPLMPEMYLSLLATFGIPALLLILFFHVIVTNMKITLEDITYTLLGILYVVGFMVFIPLTYSLEGNISGKFLVWYIIFPAWGTDIFAYIFGMRIGKTKFSKVSPKKSVEGCIAGTIGAVVLTILLTVFFNMYFGLEISYLTIGIISFVLSIIGQIGDFSASVIKRSFEIKDFSELFPGHGGMLDRIDSVMYIAPFAYLLLTICL